MSRSPYKSFDAFAKPIEGITTKTSIGGFITVLASTTAALLFLSQLFLYWQVDIQHSIDLAPSFPLSIVIPTEGGFSKSMFNNKPRKNQNPGFVASVNKLAANRIDVLVHITFPYLNCKVLDYSHNGAKFSTGDFSKHNGFSKFTKRRPTEYDYAQATSNPTAGLGRKTSTDPNSEDSCTLRGTITVPRIGGELGFFMSDETFRKTAQMVQQGLSLNEADAQTGGHDVSHYIHEITFGTHFPLAVNPLKDTMVRMESPSGIGLHQMGVKLVPTKYKRYGRRTIDAYQLSVSSYVIKPELLVGSNPLKLPGLAMHYDFNPVAVHHVESRENFFVFLSSLVGIVGGVFVTVRLVSSVLVTSAQQIIKKQD